MASLRSSLSRVESDGCWGQIGASFELIASIVHYTLLLRGQRSLPVVSIVMNKFGGHIPKLFFHFEFGSHDLLVINLKFHLLMSYSVQCFLFCFGFLLN